MRAPSLTLACVLSTVTNPQDGRKPIPDPAAQRVVEKLIRDVFKAEYTKTATADRQALARKLLQQGVEANDDLTSRYVLFREARDVAAQAGDVDTSFEAIAEMARTFQVDALPMKAGALAVVGRDAKLPEECRRMAQLHLRLVEEAVAADAYETASQAASAAVTFARRCKEPSVAAKADDVAKQAGELRRSFERVRKAKEKLAADPDDPASNFAVGEFRCLLRGDWEAGLPFLAKGPDGPLKQLADKELAKPENAGARAAIGDGWWELAEKEGGTKRASLRRRAVHWYELAAPDITGLGKPKVMERLAQIIPGLFGHWRLDETSGVKAADSSGNSRHGIVEGAKWTSGQLGGALIFNGLEDRVVIDAGEIPLPWTAAMWVKRQDSPQVDARLIDSATYAGGTSLRLESMGRDLVGFTRYGVGDYTFNYSAPAGTWVHLAFVGTQKVTSLYVDGALVSTVEKSIPLFVDRLGSHGSNTLKGCLDDVRVYMRALEPKEITTIFEAARR